MGRFIPPAGLCFPAARSATFPAAAPGPMPGVAPAAGSSHGLARVPIISLTVAAMLIAAPKSSALIPTNTPTSWAGATPCRRTRPACRRPSAGSWDDPWSAPSPPSRGRWRPCGRIRRSRQQPPARPGVGPRRAHLQIHGDAGEIDDLLKKRVVGLGRRGHCQSCGHGCPNQLSHGRKSPPGG